MSCNQSWKQLTSIYLGGAICLPMILIGQELTVRFGFLSALLAILFGNTFLLVIGHASAVLSIEERKSTSEAAEKYFGTDGAKMFAAVIVISMLGWFAIQLNMMALSLSDLLGASISVFTANILLGVLVTLGCMYGMKSLGILANFCVPLMILTLLWALFCAPPPSMMDAQEGSLIRFEAISLVMTVGIAAVIDMPTFFQYARTRKDAVKSSAIMFIVGLPSIECIGAYLGASSNASSLMETLQAGHGYTWSLWIALFMILAGWTTNNTNLFSGGVNASMILSKMSERKRLLLAGAVGTALACTDPLHHLEGFLTILGVGIASVGGAMLCSFAVNKIGYGVSILGNKMGAIVGCLSGIIITFCEVSLTAIPLLDAFLIASLITMILSNRLEAYEPDYTQ